MERFWKEFRDYSEANDQRFRGIETTQGNVVHQLEIVQRSVEKVRTQISPEKQGLFARLAVNALLTPEGDIKHDLKIAAIDTLDVLTDTDVNVLHEFREGTPTKIEELLGQSWTEETLGLKVVSISKLESRGLIARTSGRTSSAAERTVGVDEYWATQWRNRHYELLPFGRILLTLLMSAQPIK